MHVTLSLIFVVFALVLAILGAAFTPAQPEPYRYRLLCAAFACYMASILFTGVNL